ncbi:unnamed protein product [Cyprideis torosa]|uniref:Uncharacterized protein n=1 Tax=Cyprideis torosa TaxID=163714 RepID=A0A7R8ZPG5_9CRUS|nr:unnamed protein product [Cyprideis torosa]CAG0893872.1 unnamed protein product [Cyprideis torosa]
MPRPKISFHESVKHFRKTTVSPTDIRCLAGIQLHIVQLSDYWKKKVALKSKATCYFHAPPLRESSLRGCCREKLHGLELEDGWLEIKAVHVDPEILKVADVIDGRDCSSSSLQPGEAIVIDVLPTHGCQLEKNSALVSVLYTQSQSSSLALGIWEPTVSPTHNAAWLEFNSTLCSLPTGKKKVVLKSKANCYLHAPPLRESSLRGCCREKLHGLEAGWLEIKAVHMDPEILKVPLYSMRWE